MWWMWHGPEGHWVVNDSPGAHGADRIKSTFGDFACPQDIESWEGPAVQAFVRNINFKFSILLIRYDLKQ